MRSVRGTMRRLAALLIIGGVGLLYGCVGNQDTGPDVNNKSFTFQEAARMAALPGYKRQEHNGSTIMSRYLAFDGSGSAFLLKFEFQLLQQGFV